MKRLLNIGNYYTDMLQGLSSGEIKPAQLLTRLHTQNRSFVINEDPKFYINNVGKVCDAIHALFRAVYGESVAVEIVMRNAHDPMLERCLQVRTRMALYEMHYWTRGSIDLFCFVDPEGKAYLQERNMGKPGEYYAHADDFLEYVANRIAEDCYRRECELKVCKEQTKAKATEQSPAEYFRSEARRRHNMHCEAMHTLDKLVCLINPMLALPDIRARHEFSQDFERVTMTLSVTLLSPRKKWWARWLPDKTKETYQFKFVVRLDEPKLITSFPWQKRGSEMRSGIVDVVRLFADDLAVLIQHRTQVIRA